MSGQAVRYLPAGDTGLVVEFGDRIDRALSAAVLRLADRLAAAAIPGVVETLPSFRSLLVHYDPLVTAGAELETAIAGLLDDSEGAAGAVRLWRLPVCYEGEFAPDLAEVSERTGFTPDEIVALHAGTQFHVYMLGFVPGLPFMGDLPDSLRLPRRSDPRVRVPAGSVAIAIGLSTIYPFVSPGGWHLIGRTPVRLMDERWPSPILLAPGDQVRFERVGLAEYERILEAVARDDYKVPVEEAAP